MHVVWVINLFFSWRIDMSIGQPHRDSFFLLPIELVSIDNLSIFVPLNFIMRQLVSKSDLKKALKLKGPLGSCAAGIVYGICGFRKANMLYDKAADYQGREFTERLLKVMNVTCDVDPGQLDFIPKEGGFVVVCNHPFGAIEGMLLYNAISKVRPDFKVMANFLLAHIPNLKDVFFQVNPFTENPEWKSSLGGVKGSINHLAEGKGLGVFPAGEVSRYHGHEYPEDLPWSKSIARMIKNASVPVIPVFWEGENSRFFYFVDRINSMLGTARLPRELFNKHDKHIAFQIGKPILPSEIAEYENYNDLAAYLRSRSYALEANIKAEKPQFTSANLKPIDEGRENSLLMQELEKIREKSFLFSVSTYDCFFADYDDIPNLMHEIARQRELAFRAIGEGTGNNLDTDEFDKHYKHLILWDNAKQQLAGSYRLGIGSEIMECYGKKGFYISTLFNINASFEPYLRKTIELGRSFVCVDYQREMLPLMLLLKGLSSVILKYKDMDHFIGPVSISSWYPKFYQSMIVEYVTAKHSASGDLTHAVTSMTPFVADFNKVDKDVLLRNGMESVEKFDKFLFRLSNGSYRMPTLFKKYLKLNSKLLCFNVDPDFNDTLDGLLFLTFKDFPEEEIMPFFKDSTEEEKQQARERFGYC